MVKIKNLEEIELMRKSSLIVSKTLGMLAGEIKPGVTTLHLDKLAETFIRDHQAEPGFLGLYDYPNTLCASPNEQVVHGIPNNKPLEEGDILSVDCGALKNGFYGDHAYTFEVGEIAKATKRLLEVTKKSLYLGINQAKPGNFVGDIGNAIQTYAEKHGFSIVRELVGHGIGTELHEEPQIPNYGRVNDGVKLEAGMCIAIEPMVNIGQKEIYTADDGWTIFTKDGKASAHFEHTIAITSDGPIILSERSN